MSDLNQITDQEFSEAVEHFAAFVAQIADEPGEMVDEESKLSAKDIHIIRRIVEDSVVDIEARG